MSFKISRELELDFLKCDTLVVANGIDFNGTLDMSGFKITNLGTPTASTDAVNKTYADGLITSLLASANVWTGGQTFTADTNVNNLYVNPTANSSTALIQADATNLFVYAPSSGFFVRHTGISPFFASSLNVYPTGFEIYKDNGNLFMSGTSATNTILISGVLTMSSNQIKAVADPTLLDDVATKNYVDTNLPAVLSNRVLRVNGTITTPVLAGVTALNYGVVAETSDHATFDGTASFTITNSGVYSIQTSATGVASGDTAGGILKYRIFVNGSNITDELVNIIVGAGLGQDALSSCITATLTATDVVQLRVDITEGSGSADTYTFTTSHMSITRIA